MDLQQSRTGYPATPETRLALYHCLSRTVDALRREIGELLKNHGLSEPQYEVLTILRDCPTDGLPCGEIVARMIARDPDVTRLLNRLEEREFAERSRGSGDRRVISARLTSLGLMTLMALEAPMGALRERQLQSLGDGEAETLMRQLRRIRA